MTQAGKKLKKLNKANYHMLEALKVYLRYNLFMLILDNRANKRNWSLRKRENKINRIQKRIKASQMAFNQMDTNNGH